jgi:hypothetical protein
MVCLFIWFVFSAWDAVKITLRGLLHFSVDPIDFEATQVVVPGEMLENSDPSLTRIY